MKELTKIIFLPFMATVLIGISLAYSQSLFKTGKDNGILFFIITILSLIIYFLPYYIGRKKQNSSAILALNIFLGWTFLGWVAALIWSLTKDKN